jgi:hypothetical protein
LGDKTGVTFGFGLDWPGVHVLFPLNKRACLRLRRSAAGTSRQISAIVVTEINKFTMFCATSKIYMSAEDDGVRAFFDQWGCNIKPGVNAFMTRQVEEHLAAEMDASSAQGRITT